MTVTAEIAHSAAHAGRLVRAWSRLLCAGGLRGPRLRKRQHYCRVRAVCPGPATRGEHAACPRLRLLCPPGERLCAVTLCYVMSAATAAVPASREWMCLQLLGLFVSFPILSACTLPTLGSANSGDSVNSKTTDAVNGMKDNTNRVSPLLTKLPNKMSLGLIRSEKSCDTTYRCTLYVYSTYIFENLLSL